jgi:hypothetical protein
MNSSPDSLGRIGAPTRTLGKTDVLSPICELNEQCLRLLVDMARHDSLHTAAFLNDLLSTVSSLNSATLACAARFPFLLVDFRFRDFHWWQHVIAAPNKPWKESTWLTVLPRATAIKLSHETLMLTWHTVRTDREAAVVLLGLTQAVADAIAALRLRDLDRIAERQFRQLRPRWEDRPGVWRQLLACARSTEVDAAHAFVLHALQLTAGAALPRCDGTPASRSSKRQTRTRTRPQLAQPAT